MKRLADFFFQMAVFCFLSVAGSHAQNQADSLTTQESKALRIYLDCDLCGADDFDYIRTEIAFVNYVRDRKEAQVHVLITTQETGGSISVSDTRRGKAAMEPTYLQLDFSRLRGGKYDLIVRVTDKLAKITKETSWRLSWNKPHAICNSL
jgi:hypothetical protein